MRREEHTAGHWYFAEGGNNVGPIPWPRLRNFLISGRISHGTLVWQEGMPDWVSMEAALRGMEPAPHVGAESPSSAETAVITDAKGWYSLPVHPWRRYLARVLDISFQGIIGVIVLAYVWYSVAPLSAYKFFSFFETHKAGPVLDAVLTSFIAAVVGSVFIGLTGSSLGKIIFGIKVVGPDLKIIGIGRAFEREIHVWVKGLALGIPLFAIVTLLFSYRTLTHKGSASWDRNRYVVLYRPPGNLQAVLGFLGFFLICAIIITYRLL